MLLLSSLRHFIFQARNIARSQFSKPSLSLATRHRILNCNFNTDLKGMWAHTQLAVHVKLFSWERTGRRTNLKLNWSLVRFYFLELSCLLLLFSFKNPTALQKFILQRKKDVIFILWRNSVTIEQIKLTKIIYIWPESRGEHFQL